MLSTPLTYAQAVPGCAPSGSCVTRHERELMSALIGSVSWGLSANRSGVYAIGGIGGYRTVAPPTATSAGTYVGASYGIGVAYFERKGSNTFYLEARQHHVPAAHVGWFAPVVAGVIF